MWQGKKVAAVWGGEQSEDTVKKQVGERKL